MKVYFIGAGPGDPDLITVKGKSLIEEAAVVIYAGSLVNPELLKWAKSGAKIYDSSKMDLNEITKVFYENRELPGNIARLHTGDPSIYGAIQEQMDFCQKKGILFEVVPGVSSFSAAAAALKQELTLPGVSQTIIISREAGKTPVPGKEKLEELARSKATMALFLSVGKIKDVAAKLMTSYPPETPAAVVYRASWKDEKIIKATLRTIAEKVSADGIDRQALILVGEVLKQEFSPSLLYDPSFSHGYRTGKEEEQGGIC